MANFFGVHVTAIAIESMGFPRLNARDVSRRLFDRASEILTQDGVIPPVVFLFTNKVCFTLAANKFMESPAMKDELSFLLRKVAGESEIIGVAFATEGWLRHPTEKEKHTGVQEDDRPVKDHPGRKEAIIIQCEWYDGSQYMFTGAFTKEKDDIGIEEVKIEEPLGSDVYDGRFAHIFPPARSGGYLN